MDIIFSGFEEIYKHCFDFSGHGFVAQGDKWFIHKPIKGFFVAHINLMYDGFGAVRNRQAQAIQFRHIGQPDNTQQDQ
uniref:Protein of unassigned function n=1 Tax=Methylobacterium oryzae CBMB20 TaxID=693986 RepID=A0A088B2W3_9HYPH|nr:protein of unassigned function [Methylobacterium oryzae CBMB20]